MFIKTQTVIPANVKITKCPASEGKAKSVFTLLRAEEKRLEREADLKSRASFFAELLKAGHSVEEAMKVFNQMAFTQHTK